MSQHSLGRIKDLPHTQKATIGSGAIAQFRVRELLQLSALFLYTNIDEIELKTLRSLSSPELREFAGLAMEENRIHTMKSNSISNSVEDRGNEMIAWTYLWAPNPP